MPSAHVSGTPEFPDPDIQTINFLLGPDLIGNFLSWFLYGMLVLQTYHYRKGSRPDQAPGIKATVCGIFILESALIVITTRVTFMLFCSGWGNPNALVKLTREDAFIPVIGGLISGWVEILYAYTIYKLGKDRPWNRCVSGLIVLLAATSSSLAFFCGFRTINFTDVTSLMDIKPIYDLHSAEQLDPLRRRVDFKTECPGNHESPSEARIKSIILMSLETCLLTTTLAIAQLVLFVVLPQSRLPTMMGFITSKLYSNSLLVFLNSKQPEQKDIMPQLELAFGAIGRESTTTTSSPSPDMPSTAEVAVPGTKMPHRI